jgi:hypothetical protein
VNSSQRSPGPFPFSGLKRLQAPVTLPTGRRRRQFGQAARESGVVIIAIALYFLIRGLMTTSADRAIDHAYTLLELERSLGIAHEADLQQWVGGHPWLDETMSRLYIFGHWPVIAATLAWLLWKHHDRFRLFRNAMVISGAIGMFFFLLFPTAPPRLLTGMGFVDTVMRDTTAYRVLQPPAFTNQYAAMPSLHVGWNLLMGIAIFITTRRLLCRIFAILMPLTMYIATILTANHFILDGVAGAIIALGGLAIASVAARRHKRAGFAPPGIDELTPDSSLDGPHLKPAPIRQ